jgi:hypothetical protein
MMKRAGMKKSPPAMKAMMGATPYGKKKVATRKPPAKVAATKTFVRKG